MIKAVDLFAGFGGFTLGAELAGVEVVWAGNHWRIAVDVHQRNHPGIAHACQDLRQQDWTALPEYELLLAGPACQGHSEASQPRRRGKHDADRATAWAVVDCAEQTRPRYLAVENVVAFERWTLFPIWCAALEKLGYRLSITRSMATEHGVPQLRERTFILGSLAARPPMSLIREPASTTPSGPAFGPCIDWSAPGWRPVTSGRAGTQVRIAKGRRNHGHTFLTQHVTGHPGVPLDQPIRTITTKEMWGLVHGDQYRRLTERELARAQDFPETYNWPADLARDDVLRGIGNAVPRRMAAAAIRTVLEAA